MIAFAAILTGLSTGSVCAQNYPEKPIRFLSPGPGGTADFTIRLTGPLVSARVGQPVVVENRVQLIAAESVAKAPPDGYTLLIVGGTVWQAMLMQKLNYDPSRDLAPVMLTTSAPNILVVHPSLPVKNVKELIALARRKPGELNYGSGGTGSSLHLAAELFKAMGGLNIVRVDYKGSAPALTALVSGEVQMVFATSGTAAFLKAGKLRALAVTGAKPSVLHPELPTVASTLPGYESSSLVAMFAPHNTPAVIVSRLNQEFTQVLNRPDVKDKLQGLDLEVAASSPQELTETIKSDLARMAQVVKAAGVRAE
jgi:tripartite-type tricarboxylate transporter receptor subunit TctC